MALSIEVPSTSCHEGVLGLMAITDCRLKSELIPGNLIAISLNDLIASGESRSHIPASDVVFIFEPSDEITSPRMELKASRSTAENCGNETDNYRRQLTPTNRRQLFKVQLNVRSKQKQKRRCWRIGWRTKRARQKQTEAKR